MPATKEKWSADVTEHSDAMDLEPHIFEFDDPKEIALSVKRSAEHSKRNKGTPYQSAMSMLTFYENRAVQTSAPPRRKAPRTPRMSSAKPSPRGGLMRSEKLHDDGGQQTWVIILETGDEAMECLQRFAVQQRLDSASFKAIGAFERATLAYLRLGQEGIPADPGRGADRGGGVHRRHRAGAGWRDGGACACGAGSPRRQRHGRAPAGGICATDAGDRADRDAGPLRKRMDAASGLPLIRV